MGKKGRPRVDPTDESIGAAVRLPAREYDHVARIALQTHRTVADVLRQAIRRGLRTDPDRVAADKTR
jgi:hypothetical protein